MFKNDTIVECAVFKVHNDGHWRA